jgi:hypothetical protein
MNTKGASVVRSLTKFKRSFTQNSLFAAFIWSIRGSKVPAPNFIKWKRIRENFIHNAFCVETGTYLGETTSFLSSFSRHVITIEPSHALFKYSVEKFKNRQNVEVLNGTSEDLLEKILKKIPDGTNVNFWLDGHFSGDVTFEGLVHSPINHELALIEKSLPRLGHVVIAVDDFREFNVGSVSSYPSRDFLVQWAGANNLFWDVQLDMFFMKKDLK